MHQHKNNTNKWVYFEQTGDIGAVIAGEKQITTCRHEKNNALVESLNRRWEKLALDSALSKQDLSLTLEMTGGYPRDDKGVRPG